MNGSMIGTFAFFFLIHFAPAIPSLIADYNNQGYSYVSQDVYK